MAPDTAPNGDQDRVTDSAARESMCRAHSDLRAMKRISKDWNTLTDAGKRFMLAALSSGMKDGPTEPTTTTPGTPPCGDDLYAPYDDVKSGRIW